MDFVCFGVPPANPDYRQGYWLQVYLMTMSIYRVDPANRVIFLTGPGVDVSKKIPFSDVFRSPGDPRELMTWRTAAWADYLRSSCFSDDTVLLDPDILVQTDPGEVFRGEPFDVGFTYRATKGEIKDPINAGVVFCPAGRNAADCMSVVLEAMRAMDHGRRRWMGDQEAICALLPSGTFAGVPPERVTLANGITVGLFPSDRWNFSPDLPLTQIAPEDIAEHWDAHPFPQPILHFKGDRKQYLLAYAQAVLAIELPGT